MIIFAARVIPMPLDKDLKKADRYLAGLEDAIAKDLIGSYSSALKEVRGTLAEMYRKYGDGVTHIDMAKFNRLQKLEKEIGSIISEMTGKNATALRSGLVNMYDESFLYTAFSIERETQLKLAYSHVNKKQIKEAIQMPISGLTLNETLRKNRQDIIFQVRRQITQGLIQGEGYTKMAKRIQSTFENDINKALRVVATESHRIQQDARLKSIEHAAKKGVIMKKVWDAALDTDTRDAHAELDGTKIDVDENFVSSAGGSGPAPGQLGNAADDINCRCSVRIEIVGYEAEVRRARDEDGRSEVIPYTTYNEWKKNRIS
jgi:SPP1 gp7 family putative phage head morphogenesis protein